MPISDAPYYVLPADGLKVRDPDTLKHIPQDGASVPKSSYWRRRIRSGDVVEGKPPKPAKADAKPDAKADAREK